MAWFPASTDVAALSLRIFLGAIMAVHGFPKLFKPQERDQTIGYMKSIGVPAPLTVAVGALEFFGGLALVAGFLAQVAAGLIALEMVGTTILSRAKLGKKLVLGYELDLAYFVSGVALVFLGAGVWSLDGVLGIIVDPLWLAVVVGVAAGIALAFAGWKFRAPRPAPQQGP